jgi:uncharacterized protein (TIGR02246 family)
LAEAEEPDLPASLGDELSSLHRQLLESWNRRDPGLFASWFTDDGSMVGFDGSGIDGRAQIEDHLAAVFDGHETASYVAKVRDVRSLGSGVAILRAVAGMVPPGMSDIEPAVNTIQSMVAVKQDGRWKVALYQNTPPPTTAGRT